VSSSWCELTVNQKKTIINLMEGNFSQKLHSTFVKSKSVMYFKVSEEMELSHTDDRYRKSVPMKTSDTKSKRR